MAKRRTTTKDIALLHQLYRDKQLNLAPEFQRKSVWPRAAKAYLVDTILNDLPIPPLLFRRASSAQSGRPGYEVIDGQQRLRAVFSFLNDDYRLTESEGQKWHGKKFTDLPLDTRQRILDYDFVVEELSGYSDILVKDIFTRTNRYTVSLSQQELRHAKAEGAFAEFVEQVGNWDFWREQRVLTSNQYARMRNVEFAAELAILLAEGTQDKKLSIDVWYAQYREHLPLEDALRTRLRSYLDWILVALPDLRRRRYRKPVDLYALIGALDDVSVEGDKLDVLDPELSGERLRDFEVELDRVADALRDPLGGGDRPELDRLASRYSLAASRQTDNIIPRQTRIDALATLIK